MCQQGIKFLVKKILGSVFRGLYIAPIYAIFAISLLYFYKRALVGANQYQLPRMQQYS